MIAGAYLCRHIRWLLIGTFAGLVALAPAGPACRAAETLWELLPYRVQVWIALSPQAAACGNLASELPAAIAARTEAVVGPRWQAKAALSPASLRDVMLRGIDAVAPKDILAGLEGAEIDKVFLVRLTYADGVYNVETADFDVRTQLAGSSVAQRVFHRSRLAEATLQTIMAAFAPVGVVETVNGDRVTFRLRGAAIPTREPVLVAPGAGSVYRVVVRTNDRSGHARRVMPIDWTYLVEESIDASRVEAKLVTGIRSPLVSKQRGRTEQLALFVHLPDRPTTLELRSADKSNHPLVGYQVFSHPAASKDTQLLGTSDSRGSLRIDPGDGGVRVLLVKSGGSIVARLPLVPGLAPTAVANLPDDQMRLEVEGLITGFQEELVDQIARRQVLMARIRSRMKAGKTDDAKRLMDELRRLRSQQDLSRQLLVERSRRTSDDPRTQRQIDKMFDDTQTVINRYLDGRSVDRLESELTGGAVHTESSEDGS